MVHGTIEGDGSQNVRQAGNAGQLNPPGSLIAVALVSDVFPEFCDFLVIYNLQTRSG